MRRRAISILLAAVAGTFMSTGIARAQAFASTESYTVQIEIRPDAEVMQGGTQ